MRCFSRLFLPFFLCSLMCFFSCGNKIPEKKGFQELHLYSYDKKSRSLNLSKSDSDTYLYYYLKDVDVDGGMLSNDGNIQNSLEVRFVAPQNDTEVILAFLYQSDFTKDKLNSSLPERPLSKCTLPAGKSAVVSLAFPAGNIKIKGFLVHSKDDVTIQDIAKTKTVTGFTETESEVSWSFDAEGGDMETFADKIPQEIGFQTLRLYAYGKDSESLSLSETSSASYLFYYLKDADFAKGILAQSGNIPQSLEVRFAPPKKDADVIVAFLYDSDFIKDKLSENLAERPLAKCTVPAGKSTRVRLAFPADKTKVKGFLVYSAGTVSVDDVAKTDAVIGWSSTDGEVSWSFGAKGGDAKSFVSYTGNDAMTADFSTSSGLSSALDGSVQEYVRIYYRDDERDAGSNGRQGVAVISAGGNKFTVRRSPQPQKSEFYVPYLFGAGKNGSENRRINIESGATMVCGIEYVYVPTISGFSKKGERLPAAIKSDLGCIPTWPSELWRRKDFELFQWDMFPNMLLFDFANYKIQDDYLKRLAFYVEKTGYRGKLWADKDIANLHGYNAHDYRAESLANFYNAAIDENFTLNESEYFLRDILALYEIIRLDADGVHFVPGKGGIISISKESPVYLRTSLLAHESFHGIYFVDEAFREKVSEVCATMDQKSLQFLKSYFASQPTLGYDLNDTYLVENEIMAYIMQQSVSAQASYFADNIAWRGSVMNALPDLASYVRQTKASGLTAAASMLDEYVFNRWGLNSGRTSMVSVSQR